MDTTLSSFDRISWNIDEDPSRAARWDGDYKAKTPLSDEERGRVVSLEDLTIVLPTSRCGSFQDEITVKIVDGRITVEQLLQAVYRRYQEPLTQQERNRYIERCRTYVRTVYLENPYPLSRSMGGLVPFASFARMEDGKIHLYLVRRDL